MLTQWDNPTQVYESIYFALPIPEPFFKKCKVGLFQCEERDVFTRHDDQF
jgi:hypothetical protein